MVIPVGVSQTQKKKFIRDYEEAEGIRLDPSNIQKNPGRRNFAKIMLNCLWGKLAQREKMSQTEYISKPSQYFDLITNPNIIVKNVEIFDNECPFIMVNYETKLDHIDTHATANVIVGSYVTACARMELYKVMQVSYTSHKICFNNQNQVEPSVLIPDT